MAGRGFLVVADITPAELQALAAAIREIRGRKELTQEEVAAEGGLSRNTVGQLERYEIAPSFAVLLGVARGLGVRPSEIVRRFEELLEGG